MEPTHTTRELACLALRDGARVCLRPLEATDLVAVEEVFAGLGDESRRERFHGPKPRLAANDLGQLLSVDHRDHDALVAFDEATGRAVGIARFVRDRAERDLAEVAFEVTDDWHGRGLGTLLVHSLARRALGVRVKRFRGFVLATNERAKAVLRAAGRVTDSRRDGSAVELVIELG